MQTAKLLRGSLLSLFASVRECNAVRECNVQVSMWARPGMIVTMGSIPDLLPKIWSPILKHTHYCILFLG